MSAAVLKRRSFKDPARLPLVGDQTLLRGRVHEFCGPARETAALWLARATDGPLIWIAPAFARESLHMEGLRAFIDPGRLLIVSPDRAVDLLWSMEEALRSGTAALIVTELSDPPALTPVRRLTLAAEAGAALTGHAPTGVILTPGDGGAAGVESRWHLSPRHHGEARIWHLERRRARLEPPKAWTVTATSRDFLLEAAALAGT